ESEACFAALLGSEKNGRWRLAPADDILTTTRRYRGDSLILETTFVTAGGAITVIDFMPPRGEASDIIRIVQCDRGKVAMRMELILRFGFGSETPWVKRGENGALLAIRGPDMTVLRTPVQTHGEDMKTVANFEVSEGDSIPFVLTYGPSHLAVPASISYTDALANAEEFWMEWSSRCSYQGDHKPLVMRSLITLKALTYRPTGGIVAAPTTSLPERLGGSRNWDYRFCWLRDATFTLLALINSGYTEEALAWHRWLLRAAAGAPDNMQIMYGITGQRRLLEWQADWLDGYEGAKPVRIGNAAHAQLQLDVYGELIDAFHQSRVAAIDLDGDTWAVERTVLEHLATIWNQPDSGIWERRGPRRHYVSSKVLVWVAFDRGIKSAEKFGLDDAPIGKWRELRDTIHREICERGFDRGQNSFTEYYGSPMLDASILLMPSVGFLPPDDPRIAGTLKAVERHLLVDGFVMRHDPREVLEGQPQPLEGAFLACSLWLADAYVLAGDIDKGQALFDRVVGISNDLGLLSEEYDTVAQRLTGNYPQALTHIALINTAHALADARKPAKKPAAQRSN
ncbi:MAG: glycoside hydrolase 15-related protein, partial [Tardiphaga sp.]|nr:glycoside hydrolase 15-related protein [Tardiphaga sp.]